MKIKLLETILLFTLFIFILGKDVELIDNLDN